MRDNPDRGFPLGMGRADRNQIGIGVCLECGRKPNSAAYRGIHPVNLVGNKRDLFLRNQFGQPFHKGCAFVITRYTDKMMFAKIGF